jgi:cytochrome c553
MRTTQEEMRASQELLKEEVLAKLDAHYERMMARMGSQLEKIEATVDIFQGRLNKMDTMDLEAN